MMMGLVWSVPNATMRARLVRGQGEEPALRAAIVATEHSFLTPVTAILATMIVGRRPARAATTPAAVRPAMLPATPTASPATPQGFAIF